MFVVIRRTFQHLDEKNSIPLYKSLVRSHLDFASPIWSPMSMKLIDTEKSDEADTRHEIFNICRKT